MTRAISKKTILVIILMLLILICFSIALIFYVCNPITDIYIKSLPQKIKYYESENFDSTGLVVYAKYKYYGLEEKIENFKIVTDSPLNSLSTKVEVIYEYNGEHKATSFDIEVQPRVIKDIEIFSYPTKTNYYEGEYFDVSGLELQVNCFGEAQPFEPKNIVIDKQNTPLSVSDKEIVISYTENNKTIYANIEITVTKLTEQNQEIIEIKKLIDLLPDENNVSLDDESTIIYVKNAIEKLSEEQKIQIDTSKIERLNKKIERLKKEQETELNKEYDITYQLKNISAEIDFNNVTKYKNIDGIVNLNTPISNQLYNDGYDFVHWENSEGRVVQSIENIVENTTFYAVYELSTKIDLKFVYNDFEIGIISVNRYNGTNYIYNLINNYVSNFIFEKTNKLPKSFMINGNEVSEIETNNYREIQINVITQSLEDIVDDNIETPQNNAVVFVMGENVKEFVLNNGYLTEEDLSDIYAIYNEQNTNNINYYVVSGIVKTYDDLDEINFGLESNNIVVVTQNENSFNVTLNYTGGKKIFNNLVGKQKIIDALNQYANNDKSVLTLVEELSKIFDFEQILYQDIEFLLQDRVSFEINVHIDDEINTFIVPDSQDINFKLTDKLPKPKKLGYLFSGWANTLGGEILSNEFLNIIVQNSNKNVDLYAIWEVDPNYKKPEDQVNYLQNFVGEWTAKFERNGVIVDVILTLEKEGVYSYKIYNNGIETVNVFGDYRYENDEIVIYFLANNGEYEYIEKTDLDFNLTFVDSNMLITNCFYVSKYQSSASIETFNIVLSKDSVKLENYYGNPILGSYKIEVLDILTNTPKTYILELINNGNVLITFNGVTQNAYYRILKDKVILLSNGFIGVLDITEYVLESNKI